MLAEDWCQSADITF